MHELEFLPAWYPRLQQLRRFLLLEVWISIALAAGLGLWAFLADRNCQRRQDALDVIRSQWQQTNAEVRQMEQLENLQKQLRQQAEVLDRLGQHLKCSLLLSRLEEVLPANVALTSLECSVEEISSVPTATLNPSTKDKSAAVDRQLRVKLAGVAPTDVELATFVIELNKVPFFDHVSPTYVKDGHQGGHVMREFELTFSVNLNGPGGS